MSTYFYCRVSKSDMNEANQIQALSERYASPTAIFTDSGVSGSKEALKRPEFAKMYAGLQAGDTVIATAIDRLGRNGVDVLTIVQDLINQGVSVITMREGVDFSTSTGRMVLGVLASVAQMERENLIERTKQGLDRAKAEGKQLGKPVDQELYERIKELYEQGMKKSHIAIELSVSRPTIDRALKTI